MFQYKEKLQSYVVVAIVAVFHQQSHFLRSLAVPPAAVVTVFSEQPHVPKTPTALKDLCTKYKPRAPFQKHYVGM